MRDNSPEVFEEVKILPMGFWKSLLFFGIPSLLLFLATQICIPFLVNKINIKSIIAWFLCGGVLVFVPLFFASFFFFKKEGNKFTKENIFKRFRLDEFTKKDFVYSVTGIFAISILTFAIIEFGKFVNPDFSAQPSFMNVTPITKNEIWILAIWLPFFFFNIFGEGLFWRGYIFPKQELAFGKFTWLVHGFFWMIFHFSFGMNLLLTLLPIIFIASYIVQKTKNTWNDIFIHSFINGTGFLLVIFGIVK